MKANLFLLVLLAAVLICPVSAELEDILSAEGQILKTETVTSSFSWDGTSGDYRLVSLTFSIPRDERVDFTLNYGTSSSVSGYATTTRNLLGWSTSTIEFGGTSKSYEFWDTQPDYDYDIATYWRTNFSQGSSAQGFIVYGNGYQTFPGNDLAVTYPISNINSNLIYGFSISGTQPFEITYTYAKTANVGEYNNADDDYIEKILKLARAVFSFGYVFVTSLISGIQFFFVGQNLQLIIGLYIAGSMAITAYRVKGNPVAFIPRFFKDQEALFRFIMHVWTVLLDSIGTIRGWFRI